MDAKVEDVNTDNATAEPSCGEILRQTRESLSIELSVVAERLKLPLSRLREIEADEFDATVSATFYRGYIRAYARLLEINPEPLLEHFNAHSAVEAEIAYNPSLSGLPSGKRATTGSGWFKWLSFAIGLFIVALAVWGLYQRYAQSSEPSQTSDTELSMPIESSAGLSEPDSFEQAVDLDLTSLKPQAETHFDVGLSDPNTATQAPLSDSTNDLDKTSSSGDEAGLAASLAESRVTDAAASSSYDSFSQQARVEGAENPALSSDHELVFAFVGDCWVEVKDATGERLAYGLKKNGKVMTVRGQPPFSLLLGDPSVVSLQHNQQPVDLSGYPPGRSVTLEIN